MSDAGIDLSAVRPGDVLLHMGRGEISKLIAWASDSSYSHSALVFDAETVIEAAGAGVRKAPLTARATDTKDFSRIDVYRFGGRESGLNPAQLLALQNRAQGYLGALYPLDELFELGVVCALRSKLDWPTPAKWFLRIVLDHVIHTDPAKMVCSEFIYRCFAEAATQPAGALRPRIEVLDTPPAPFPHIDWLALLKEYEEARHASPNRTLPPAPAGVTQADRDIGEPTLAMAQPDPGVAAQAAEIRRRRSGMVTRSLASRPGEIVDPWPNPATVTPGDLANSPSFVTVGQLLSAA